MPQSPQNVITLKISNRANIFEQIRRGALSRVEIAQKTGLKKPAVTVLTNEMIKEGILREIGPSERRAERGRTSILLDLVADYAYAVGISLHRRNIQVSVMNLKMEKVAGKERETASFPSADAAMDWCAKTAGHLLARLSCPPEKCVGIGVSSPGSLDHQAGVILEPPNFPLFHHYPVTAKLKEYFDCPIFLENNAVSLAVTDFYMRGGPRGNSLFVVVADGIGSALLQDGAVFRGAGGFSGELGHVCVETGGEVCACGNTGCLELYATADALKKRFPTMKYEQAADRAQAGDEQAGAVLRYLADRFGKAFVTAINLFDLDTIVMFGEYSYRSHLLTSEIERYINRHSLVAKLHPVAVMASELAFRDMSIAAAVPALNAFFARTNSEK